MTGAAPGPIVVASTVDASFLPLVGPVVMSMAHFASPDRPIDYRVFYSGLESADSRALDGFEAGPVTVRLIAPPDDFARFTGRSHMGTATLVRLSAAELMPDIDRVVFLDVDLLVLDDIGELFDSDLGGRPLGAVVDFPFYGMLAKQRAEPPANPLHNVDVLLRETIGFTETNWYGYHNTGVVVMDLAAFRREDFGRRSVALLEEIVDRLPWPDQDIFNIVLKDRIMPLDPKWNVQLVGLLFRDLAEIVPVFAESVRCQRTKLSIIHFSASVKPWLRTANLPYFGDWWHFVGIGPTVATIRESYRTFCTEHHRWPNPVTVLTALVAGVRYGRRTA